MNWIRGCLWLALLLMLASFSALDDMWQVLVLPAPPAGVGPGEGAGVLYALLNIWHGLIRQLADIGLISDVTGYQIITRGFSSGDFLRAMSAFSGLIALILAMFPGNTTPTSARQGSTVADAREMGDATPASALARVTESLAQTQNQVADLLLDPQAQPVVEPLADIGRELASVHQSLESLRRHLN